MLKVGQKVKIIVPKLNTDHMHSAHNKIGEIIQITNAPTNIFEQENFKLNIYVKVDHIVHLVNRNWLEVIE